MFSVSVYANGKPCSVAYRDEAHPCDSWDYLLNVFAPNEEQWYKEHGKRNVHTRIQSHACGVKENEWKRKGWR